MIRRAVAAVFCLPIFFGVLVFTGAAAPQQSHAIGLDGLVSTPAVSGYESELSAKISASLASLHPAKDNLGDVIVTIGVGSPHRLIATPIDEPGFVVSAITDDGYLRLQRLPQWGLSPIFNQLYSTQPVLIRTSSGKWIDGVVSGLSIHLQPYRTNPPKSSDIDDMYVDIGAASAAEARKAGVDVLSPVVIRRRLMNLAAGDSAGDFAGVSIGDRFGVAALLAMLHDISPANIHGTLTVAFVVQQRTGARGLQRILSTIPADEMIYVGSLLPGGPIAGVENMRRAPRREPGSGVLIGLPDVNGAPTGFAADLQQLAAANKIPVESDYSAGIIPRSYLPAPDLPAKWAHLGIAISWPDTPAELVGAADLNRLQALLEIYAQGSVAGGSAGASGAEDAAHAIEVPNKQLSVIEMLRNLTETYGVSEHEAPVRDEVKALLPAWAKPETDDAGNLVLQLGAAPAGSKSPRILVVAHMDEIGYVVKSISKDGRLELGDDGGGYSSFFLGHPALVHSSNGDHDAIMELPAAWERPDFDWKPEEGQATRVDVGARSPEEVAKLGIKVGDTITIPKKYRSLLGTRANARSFDDRVGCTALISAVWSLRAPLKDRDVTFVWSTGEELGLLGAAAVAKRLAAEGHPPDYVFAVDTFVSADSPLESKRFADAPIGKGFVVRAVDNSNIVRSDLVAKVLALARANQIPAQYGVTGGGNDGSAYVRYGSVDIALAWPLRYAHSPGEVIDTRDAESLARIVAVIAKSW